MHTLHGRVVLLADDDLREAQRLLQFLRLRGASVLGPVPTVQFALDIIQTERNIDYAILDRTLRDGTTTAVADALLRRQIPFVFVNDEPDAVFEPQFGHLPCLTKPLALREFAEHLWSGFAPAPRFDSAAGQTG